MENSFKLHEFNVYNKKSQDNSSEDECVGSKKSDNATFMIQMFGINEKGKTASIIVDNYCPFFYIKVDDNWGSKNEKGVSRTYNVKNR